MSSRPAPRVAVVGGGISGLSAAWELSRTGARVIVLETSDRLGGKLRADSVGDVAVDVGADAMLARVPYGGQLADEVGLGDKIITPKTGQAGIWLGDRMRPLPPGTVMGIPGDLGALARSEVLSARGMSRVPLDLALPGAPCPDDVSVGSLVARRLGAELVDRLVDPLLGGVYAGHAHDLSLHATIPSLAAPVAEHRSLLMAVRQVQSVRPTSPGPVFFGLQDGMFALPKAVAEASGAEMRTGTTVRALEQTPSGWRLETGSAADPQELAVDRVVLAVPAPAAARLLRSCCPHAAELVGGIDYASLAIVTMVLDGPCPGSGSGYLVPSAEAMTTKAVTFTSRKWGRPGSTVVRASVGRFGEQRTLQRSDLELFQQVRDELVLAVGRLPGVLDWRVTRWGGALPQYAVGHLDRVAAVRRALEAVPGLVVAGAAYDGVGVPACIKSGRDAARRLLQAESDVAAGGGAGRMEP